MFQSDKGIWLLARNLQTLYIGAPVEQYNSNTIVSAFVVPGVNQVRFTLDNGITLMFDYFYQQWGTFLNVKALSSIIYQGLHTFLETTEDIYQETPGLYLDESEPVELSFTTSWFNLAGIQGYQRIYDFYLIGKYYSPHKLEVSVAYDYGPISQQIYITPSNYTGPYGSDVLYGDTPLYGGPGSLEQWRIHTSQQTCQSFQITVRELFDPSFNTIPGEGLTLSGLTCRLGIKASRKPIAAANSKG
jgi:hypothetical protein